MNTKEALAKVVQVSEEHLIEQEVKECTTLSTKVKEEVEQMRTEHDSFKAKLNAPSISS